MSDYVRLKRVIHIIDLVMSDDNIKHKGKAIRKRLNELPTLNVVRVVRCGNCANYTPLNELEGRCNLHGIDKCCEDFCSDGERGAEE